MAEFSNPDQALVHALVHGAPAPIAVDCNPVAADLSTVLESWDAASRTLQVGFRTAARHVQGNGAVHGGVVTTMLDTGLAFVALGLLAPGKVAVTVALNVHFEKAVLPGEFIVRAKIDRLGGRLAFTSAELAPRAGGDVLARATATLAVI